MNFINNPICVLSIICFVVVISVYVCKTKFGKHFGVALLVILFTAVLSNVVIIPSASNSIPLMTIFDFYAFTCFSDYFTCTLNEFE